MTRDMKVHGNGGCGLIGGSVVAALVLVALALTAHAADAEARATKQWTRTVQLRMTAQELGRSASTSPRQMARAALRRSARRLGLPRSLRGVRLVQHLSTPAGPAGGRALHSLRFAQTSRGRRVLWSQIDVLVSGREVRLIRATVVPVKPGMPAARATVSLRRALAIAHRAVAGHEEVSAPQLVTYAGNPVQGRLPRLAWVVETLPDDATRSEAPTGLCVVIDARRGRVLSTWRGSAAHSPARSAAPGALRAGSAAILAEQTIALNDALMPARNPPIVPELETGRGYTTWGTHGSAFTLANWNAGPGRIRLPLVFKPELDAAIRNVKDVVVHMCFTRGFCSNTGVRDDLWEFFKVTGNSTIRTVGKYVSAFERVFLDPTAGYQNDLIAHEFGHEITIVRGGDSLARDPEQLEVSEGLADMFAYDFDREDATLGEDGPAGRGTGVPYRSWNTAQHGEPLRMADYRCNTDAHFNSEILSHAYFRLVQQVGPDVAGFLLYEVPPLVGPGARYTAVANAFVSVAAAKYAASPQVAAAARQAFVVEGGMDKAPPPCSPVAPPPPPPPAPPPPAPPSQVAVPDVRGDTPGAASTALSAAGLHLGTQRDVIDNTCNDIGAVLPRARAPAPWSLPEPP